MLLPLQLPCIEVPSIHKDWMEGQTTPALSNVVGFLIMARVDSFAQELPFPLASFNQMLPVSDSPDTPPAQHA